MGCKEQCHSVIKGQRQRLCPTVAKAVKAGRLETILVIAHGRRGEVSFSAVALSIPKDFSIG